MKKTIRNILLWMLGIILLIVLLLGGATLMLNTKNVQQILLQAATERLSERLQTRVVADSISVNLFGMEMSLYGLSVDDQQGRQMLQMERLKSNLGVRLRKHELIVKRVESDGLKALLVRSDSDSVANYEFLIKAFSKKPKPDKQPPSEKKSKNPLFDSLSLDVHRLLLKDASVTYNKADTVTALMLGLLDVKRDGKKLLVGIDSLHLQTDNHQPRKNAERPKKGAFDAGHLDVKANMKWVINHLQKDSLNATLAEATIHDPETGIHIKDLRLNVLANPKHVTLENLVLQQDSTLLNIDHTDINLPDKKTGRQLTFRTGNITGHIVLHDIARPFAPVLKDFHLPLKLSAQMNGTEDQLVFHHVKVGTDNRKFHFTADGVIDHLKGKHLLTISFDINQLQVKQGMPEVIISQFQVKKLLMDQLYRLGDISYNGHFDVLWKRESFRGRLTTAAGPMDFRLTIDDKAGNLTGTVSSPTFRIGKVLEMPKIGDIDWSAEFNIDISKDRTAKMRRKRGGKLPIGIVKAKINECSYDRIRLKNITADVESDGAEARGSIVQQGKRRDIYSQFIYTGSNDQKNRLKIINPGIRFHKKQTEDGQPGDTKNKMKKDKKAKAKDENSSTKVSDTKKAKTGK